MSGKKILMAGAPLIAGIMLIVAYAFSSPTMYDPAPYESAPGTIIVCEAVVTGVVSGEIEAKLDGLAGPATFQHVAGASPVPAATYFTALDLIDLYHSLVTVDYGEICVRGDLTRPLTSSVYTTGPTPFPATSTRKFHAIITVGAFPGIEFKSIDPVSFEDPNLTEWPQNGAVYQQVGTTRFERSDRPGLVAITVSDATLTLTAR